MKKLFKLAPWLFLLVAFLFSLLGYHFGSVFYWLALLPLIIFVLQVISTWLVAKTKDKINDKLNK